GDRVDESSKRSKKPHMPVVSHSKQCIESPCPAKLTRRARGVKQPLPVPPWPRGGSRQIQFWKMINRWKVCIEVSTKAAEIGNIAAKPNPATATNAHSGQRGMPSRRSAYTSARLAVVADGKPYAPLAS